MGKERGDEIDLVELINTIRSNRRFIIRATAVFFLLGGIIAFTSKVEYEATSKLMPESQNGGIQDLNGLGGLAGLAGINLTELAGENALTPDLYPEIVRSTPFVDQLIRTPVYFEREDTIISSLTYFRDFERPSLTELLLEYTIGLPGKIKSIFVSDEQNLEDRGMIRYSKDDWSIIESYMERLTVEVDSKTGIIIVNTEMPDPVAAAKVTEFIVDKLTIEIINYKIEKAKVNKDFIDERFQEVKSEYEQKQELVARYADQNRNLSNSLIRAEYKRLQNEMEIAFEVYKGMASQLEQAKIKVKEETPVFTVLEPVKIPEQKSKPRRLVIIILFTIVGALLSTAYSVVFPKLRSTFMQGAKN